MASQGPNLPSAYTSNTGNGGSYSWAGLSNATNSDDTYAFSTISPGGTSYQVLMTNFGFSIPSGATINGITASIERKKSGNAASNLKDSFVRIIKGGTISGTDKKSASNWPTTDTVATYGGSSDLWGLSWTYTDINDANFGIAFAVSCTGSKWTATANVDSITLTIEYTVGGGGGSQTNAILFGGD